MIQYGTQHSLVCLQQDQENYSCTLMNFPFSYTPPDPPKKKDIPFSTLPANFKYHHHCSASHFPLQPSPSP